MRLLLLIWLQLIISFTSGLKPSTDLSTPRIIFNNFNRNALRHFISSAKPESFQHAMGHLLSANMYQFEEIYRNACLVGTLILTHDKVWHIANSKLLSLDQKRRLLNGSCVSNFPDAVIYQLIYNIDFRTHLSAILSIDHKFMVTRMGLAPFMLLFKSILANRHHHNILGMQWCGDLIYDGWDGRTDGWPVEEFWEFVDERCIHALSGSPKKLIILLRLVLQLPTRHPIESPEYWREVFFRLIRGEALFNGILERWPGSQFPVDRIMECFKELSIFIRTVGRMCNEWLKSDDPTSNIRLIILAIRQIIRSPLIATRPALLRELFYIVGMTTFDESGHFKNLLWFSVNSQQELLSLAKPPEFEKIHSMLFEPGSLVDPELQVRWSMDLYSRLPSGRLPECILNSDPETIAPIPFLRFLESGRKSGEVVSFGTLILKARPDICEEILINRYAHLITLVPSIHRWHHLRRTQVVMRQYETQHMLFYQPDSPLGNVRASFGINYIVNYLHSTIFAFPILTFYTCLFTDPNSQESRKMLIGDLVVYILNSFLQMELLKVKLNKLWIDKENDYYQSDLVIVPNHELITETQISAVGMAFVIAALSGTRLSDWGLQLDLEYYVSCVKTYQQNRSIRNKPVSILELVESMDAVTLSHNNQDETTPTNNHQSNIGQYWHARLSNAFIKSLVPLTLELQVSLLELYEFLFMP